MRTAEEILEYVETMRQRIKQSQAEEPPDRKVIQAVFNLLLNDNQNLMDFIQGEEERDCIAEPSKL